MGACVPPRHSTKLGCADPAEGGDDPCCGLCPAPVLFAQSLSVRASLVLPSSQLAGPHRQASAGEVKRLQEAESSVECCGPYLGGLLSRPQGGM